MHSLCRFSLTGIITTSQRRCHARDTHNLACIFYNARFVATRFGNSLVDFGFVMYQHELTDAIIGCKHDVPFFVRSEALGPLEYVEYWLILMAPSCLNPYTTRTLKLIVCQSHITSDDHLYSINQYKWRAYANNKVHVWGGMSMS